MTTTGGRVAEVKASTAVIVSDVGGGGVISSPSSVEVVVRLRWR